MSKNYNSIKRYYGKGWYTKEDLRDIVESGKLTTEEYELITGEPYEE